MERRNNPCTIHVFISPTGSTRQVSGKCSLSQNRDGGLPGPPTPPDVLAHPDSARPPRNLPDSF
eukprot:1144077-Pelagomonas_calceolata.AAC.10